MNPDASQETVNRDATLFGRCVGSPAVVVAMDEEAEPFLARATERAAQPLTVGPALVYAVILEGDPVLLVRTGIGLVNAASALTAVIERFEPSAVISAGSAGGLRSDVNVGDLVIGTDYCYADADATAFGYLPGQVPGMPESYFSAARLLAAAEDVIGADEQTVLRGTMLSGGSFVTEANVGATREIFPNALSTDMETVALAQVCATRQYPFLAVRSVSDLCGPAAGQQFHLEIDLVAEISASAVCQVLSTIRQSTSE
ncbi:5'-methylthioadenosine/S-adenosylhomocysteine nucleosidase [Kocuria sp. cx-455]|uniref:5'-methylthioadenosine/S-adenosylhomocysteine nucleosidase n=1 Tax=Kocuria sp. cx-455 TaxID=2771377 RepID=UPI003D70FFAC